MKLNVIITRGLVCLLSGAPITLCTYYLMHLLPDAHDHKCTNTKTVYGIFLLVKRKTPKHALRRQPGYRDYLIN